MKKLKFNKKIKNITAILLLIISVYFLLDAKILNVLAEGESTITKTDNIDLPNSINMDAQTKDNTYTIDYNASSNIKDSIYVTQTDECPDSGHTYKYNNRYNGLYSTNYGGEEITYDGQYFYTNSKCGPIRKLEDTGANLELIDSIGGYAGNGVAVDGKYLYAYDTEGGWLKKLNKENNFQLAGEYNLEGEKVVSATTDDDFLYTLNSIGSDWMLTKWNSGNLSKENEKNVNEDINNAPGGNDWKFNKIVTDGDNIYGVLTYVNTGYDHATHAEVCKWSAENLDFMKCGTDFYTDDGDTYPATSIMLGEDTDGEHLFITARNRFIRIYLDSLDQKNYERELGTVNPSGAIRFGSYKVKDTLPTGVSYDSSNPSGTEKNGKITWKVVSGGPPITLSTKINKSGVNCGDSIINKVKLYMGNIKIAEDDDSTEITCDAASQMVKVLIKWKEGNRDESLEMKTMLKDVR